MHALTQSPTLAECLSVVADSAVLVRERCGSPEANATAQAFLALCLAVEADHNTTIQCVSLAALDAFSLVYPWERSQQLHDYEVDTGFRWPLHMQLKAFDDLATLDELRADVDSILATL